MRGFSQSFLIISAWDRMAESLNHRLSHMRIERQALIRNRWTKPQTGLDRKERIENIKKAFTVKDASIIKEKNILLVDDVYTTGATANECAKVLINGGAKKVDVLTLARAV